MRGTGSDFRFEKELQAACVRLARARGWFARRYKGPGRRSHPDYLFAKSGCVLWVEFKLPGKEPTPLQHLEHVDMLAHGLNVVWLDSIDDFRAVFNFRE